MDDFRKRSTTRIRKPSAKLKASLSGSLQASVSHLKSNQTGSDSNNKKASIKNPVKNVTMVTGKQKRRTSLNRQASAEIELNDLRIKTYKEKVKKPRTESASIVLEPSKGEDYTDKADVRKSDKIKTNFGYNVDLSHEAKSGMEVNSKQATVAGSSSDVLASVKNHTVQETMVDYKRTDMSKPVKKRTVQVCMRLNDMILKPDEKKGINKVFEQSAVDPNKLENELKDADDIKKRSDAFRYVRKDFIKEGCGFGSIQTSSVFKEDGSFIETYESETNGKDLENISKTRFESNKIKIEDCKGIREEGYTDKEENCAVGMITRDVDVQAEMEFDGLDASDEEISDVDETSTEKSFQCQVCLKVFSNKCNLRKHQALHTADKPFQCEICGMSFALKSYLRVHSVMHSGNRKHKCDICDKAFLRRSNLNAHKHSHTDVKAFSCDTCGRKFKTKLGRDSHLKEHDPEPGYKCHKCGKSYSQKAYLLKHISIHAGVKPFTCTICAKSFPYNQSLQEHMRRHAGEKPESCDICEKSFNNKRELRKHMQYHNTVSQFACQECNMFYDSQQSLNKHITKSHNRKHECDFCVQTFVNKKHLKAHQTNEHKELLAAVRKIPAEKLAKAQKVACSLCHRVFFNRYVLSKHLISKHQLGEQEMKALLNIRKKAISKKQLDQNQSGDTIEDFDKVLENDKSFRVYYKDDEMAVYVKGTENFDSRVKSKAEGTRTTVHDSISDQEKSYIVLEDYELVNSDEYGKVGFAENSSETINMKDNVVERIYTESNEKNPVASNVVETEVENVGTSDQNYYVVFTEANENSEKIIEEIDSKFVSESEIQNLGEDGAERIVLILNEGEDGKNFMLESGEHYEILADGTDLIHDGNANQAEENETIATGQVETIDFESQVTVDTHGGNIMGSSEVVQTVTDHTSEEVNLHNIPLLEQLETNGGVDELKSERNTSQNSGIRETREACQNRILQQFIINTTQNKEIPNMQHQQTPKTKYSLLEGKIALTPGADSLRTQFPVFSDTSNDRETTDFEDLLPKNSSTQEFTNFENALKSKSGDFQNPDDYNEFLDKMIQTLQKAKHAHQK